MTKKVLIIIILSLVVVAGSITTFIVLKKDKELPATSDDTDIVYATSLHIGEDKTLIVGDTYLLLPVILPANQTALPLFSSSDSTICSISESGLITASNVGEATISVKIKSSETTYIEKNINVVVSRKAKTLSQLRLSIKEKTTNQTPFNYYYSQDNPQIYVLSIIADENIEHEKLSFLSSDDIQFNDASKTVALKTASIEFQFLDIGEMSITAKYETISSTPINFLVETKPSGTSNPESPDPNQPSDPESDPDAPQQDPGDEDEDEHGEETPNAASFSFTKPVSIPSNIIIDLENKTITISEFVGETIYVSIRYTLVNATGRCVATTLSGTSASAIADTTTLLISCSSIGISTIRISNENDNTMYADFIVTIS